MSFNWIDVVKQIQTIYQAGLTYSDNPYDLERYQQLKEINKFILGELCKEETSIISDFLEKEKGYPTPKVDIRGVVFRNNKILLVREKIDGKWSIPGGWADLGFSPFEIAVKEVSEEAGIEVRAERLLAILDKKKHAHPPDLFHVYKLFILCHHLKGEPHPGMETLDAKFFTIDNLPELSVQRTTKSQIDLMFEFHYNPGKNAVCD